MQGSGRCGGCVSYGGETGCFRPGARRHATCLPTRRLTLGVSCFEGGNLSIRSACAWAFWYWIACVSHDIAKLHQVICVS